MATLTATAAQSTSPAILNVNGTMDRMITFNAVAALSAGDVVQMCKVPNGAVIGAVQVACSLSAGVLTVNLGDGNDVSAYGASVVLSASGVSLAAIPFRGIGRSYSAEDTIDIAIAGVSAAPGTAKLKLHVSYVIQNGSGQ